MKKFSLWLPVFLIIAGIVYFSSRPGGTPVLDYFPVPPRAGHFIGYALYGFFLYRALAGGLVKWKLAVAVPTFFIVLGCAYLDEYMQRFIPGRDSSLADVAVDGAGVLCALFLTRIWCALRGAAVAAYSRAENGEPGERERTRRALAVAALVLSWSGLAAVFHLWGMRPLLFAVAVVLVFTSGILTRFYKLHTFWALGFQGAAAVLLLAASGSVRFIGAYMHIYGFSTLLVFLLAACWIVLVTNSFRLIEGLDGLSLFLGTAMCTTLILLMRAGQGLWQAGLLLLVLGGCFGIYPYNFRPPVIRVGVTGALLLGFAVASVYLLGLGSTLFPAVLANTAFLFIYPSADIIHHAFFRTPNSEHALRWRRAVYLLLIIVLSAVIYLHSQMEGAPTAALAPLLALAAIPGLVYTARLLIQDGKGLT